MLNKRTKMIILILMFLIILIHPNNVNATEISQLDYSEEYKEWLNLPEEERQKTIAPKMFNLEVNTSENKVITRIKTLMSSIINPTFDLRETISNNLKIRNQGNTNACWTFATLSSLETNLALKVNKNKIYDFSESHMDYSTSQSFTDGEIKQGFSREVSIGGNFQIGSSYLTNGQGAILEENMPFIDTKEDISIKEIANKEVVTKVTDTEEFYVTDYLEDGKVDTEKINSLILKMKEHIKENGSISAGIHGASLSGSCYNNSTGAIYCSNEKYCKMDHNISIIGWNDNYSVDNFNLGNRPNANGAWIIRNSWGEEKNGIKIGKDGFMYVSYEDVNIYKQLFGIEKASENVDYDNIYQYNELGYNNVMKLNTNKIYIANVFKRDKSIKEQLTEVSLNVMQKVKCKVYVNSNNESKLVKDLQEVELKEEEIFDAGYHTIEFKNPIELTGEKFVIIIETEAVEDEYIYCATLMQTTNSFWDNVETIENTSYLTFGQYFQSNMWLDTVVNANEINGAPSNLTIKAFTVKGEKIPTPTATAKPTPTATVTIAPTATVKPTPTATVTIAPTATVKPTPTVTVTIAPTATTKPNPTATVSPTSTATTKPKPTVTVNPTKTPTSKPATPVATSTVRPVVTSSNVNKVVGGININSNSGGSTTTNQPSLPYAGKTEIIIGLIIVLTINMAIVYRKYKKIY